MFPDLTPCQVSELFETCESQHPGHKAHAILLQLASDTPTHWRDYLVTGVDLEGWVYLEPFQEGPSLRVWNHEPLSAILSPGDPVSLHPVVHLLLVNDKPLNALVVAI